jgi:hypothetical protein
MKEEVASRSRKIEQMVSMMILEHTFAYKVIVETVVVGQLWVECSQKVESLSNCDEGFRLV